MPKTVHWRGVDVDPITADMLAAIAKAAGDDIYVRGIPGFGSYRSNAASAGTDSGGGHADLSMIGYSDEQCRRLETTARSMGACAYWRPERRPDGTRYGWQNHVHVLRMDCADLSPAARSQVADYLAGYDGLYYPDGKHKDTGTRSYTGRRWLTLSASLGGPNLTPSKPASAPTPAPKPSTTGELTVANIEDAKQIWRADIIPAPGRPKTGNVNWQPDSYLRLTYEAVVRIEAQNKALTGAVSALSKSQGLDPARVQAAIDAAVKDALSGLSITLTADGA